MAPMAHATSSWCRPFCASQQYWWKLWHQHPHTARGESGWVNRDSVNTCPFSLPQSYIHPLGSERTLQWLSTGSCMLCGYTASWGDACWPNGCQAFQVRLHQEGHLAFPAAQRVHGPMMFEQGWRGTVAQKQKQSHRAQGFSSYHVKKEELKVWEQERCES